MMEKVVSGATDYLELLRLHRAELRNFGVTRIGLFGSVVRGEEQPQSDVDVLVDIEPARKDYGSFLDLADYLESLFRGRKVDLVTTAAISKYILPYVLKEVQQIEVS
jgi:predicted nucleotidyltransferase